MIVYQGKTTAAAPEMTVMTNGHYASAMKGSPKVKNTGHLAMLGIAVPMIVYQGKTTTATAMTDGRFANIPAKVMLHPVGGQSAGTTPATQVQNRGRDTVVKQGGVIVMGMVAVGQGHQDPGSTIGRLQNLVVYRRMITTLESMVIPRRCRRTYGMMDVPVGCHSNRSLTATERCTNGLTMNAGITSTGA